MRHKRYFYLFLVIFNVSLLFFSNNVIAHVNDVNFSWLDPILYDEDYPRDFEYDDTLSYIEYNSSDYYQHTEFFNTLYYDNDSYLESQYVLTNNPTSIVMLDNYYYITYSNNYVIKYDYLLNEIIEMNNTDFLIAIYYDNVRGIITDNNYFYVLCTDVIGVGDFDCYILIYDYNFTYVDILCQYNTTLIGDFVFANNSIYCMMRDYSFVEKVIQFDLNGNLVQTIDVSSNVNDGYGIAYYEGIFYISEYNDDIELYDDSWTNIDTITSLSHELDSLYIDFSTELVYSFIYYTNILYIYDLNFNSHDYNNVSLSIPNYGLLDCVSNLNITYNMETNNISYYNATYLNKYYYNTTYTFENDVIGSTPTYFTTLSETGGSIMVQQDATRGKVLEFNDTNSTYTCQVEIEYDIQSNGTYEFWYKTTDATKQYDIWFSSYTDTKRFMVRQYNELFYYYDGAIHSTGASCLDNTWYLIRVRYNISDIWDLWIDGTKYSGGGYSFHSSDLGYNGIRLNTKGSDDSYKVYIDDFVHSDYLLGYHNSIEFLNETYGIVSTIECYNGIYLVNDVNTNYNVLIDVVNDSWNVNIQLNQTLQNGTLYLYNNSNSLLFNYSFSIDIGNIKYIKYHQFYQNISHFIQLTNLSISSNNTRIAGNSGFLSYVIDVDSWTFDANSMLNITGYGIYRFYVANDTYGSANISIFQISNWIEMRSEEVSIDLSIYDINVQSPYLIVETITGLYLFDNIQIFNSLGQIILYDDRGYSYAGSFSSSNVDTSESLFQIINNKLYYQIKFNDTTTEYMKIVFDIVNIVNLNYEFIYSTYCNVSYSTIIKRIDIRYSDASYEYIDIESYYNYDSIILEQDRTTSQIEIYISDDNNQDNLTFSGYINPFEFAYSEQISISVFFDNMLLILIPIIIILALTFGISYTVRQKESEAYNKKAFFPIFLISSIIVFMLGYFDAWILFTIIIASIIYTIKKRGI